MFSQIFTYCVYVLGKLIPIHSIKTLLNGHRATSLLTNRFSLHYNISSTPVYKLTNYGNAQTLLPQFPQNQSIASLYERKNLTISQHGARVKSYLIYLVGGESTIVDFVCDESGTDFVSAKPPPVQCLLSFFSHVRAFKLNIHQSVRFFFHVHMSHFSVL